MNIIRLKVSLIGDCTVGKSCIIGQLVKKYFNTTYQTTLGLEHNIWEFKVKDSNYTIQLHIFDLTGFSVFRNLIGNQISDSNVIIYVYDATNLETFNNISLWKESFKDSINKQCVEYIVGNKIDLDKKINVDENALKKVSGQLKCEYYQVSALQNVGIEELFTEIANKFYKQYISFINSIKNFT